MRKLQLLILSAILCLSALPGFAQNPHNADIVVAQDGSGDFTALQAAIDAVPSNSTRRTVIYIKRGIYDTEKLIIPSTKKNITFLGESRDETIISYHIYNCTDGLCPADAVALWEHNADLMRTSATLTIQADGFIAENLTIRNTAGPVGQALAITVKSDKGIYRNCNLLGYQDTIYLWDAGKRSYFENCLVVGRTDYIYGAGIGYFQGCEIRSWGGGWITAPSTPKTQPFGYVFNECKVTYATGSPRNGDDGAKFSLGRPWHEYPAVSWLYCEIDGMLDPKGWPTTWNMEYAATSPDLRLYEYKNTGAGADMSGRANWVGIRAMTDAEALNYTVQNVMKGSDNWDPTAEVPAVKSYTWTGVQTSKSWLEAGNWNPEGVPATGESATVEGDFTVLADGGTFAADLNLNQGAKLDVTANSTVTYLALAGGEINASAASDLSGKIQTKAATNFNIAANLDLKATLTGVQALSKTGTGELSLSADNSNFFGDIELTGGTINASAANSLGQGDITVKNGTTLIFNADNAFSVKSVLRIEEGGKAILNYPVTLNELYINGTMMGPGTYNATTHPEVFSGTAGIMVGRPTMFTWNPTESKTWDNPANYKPALLPLAGDSVIVEIEMETAGAAFAGTILLQKANIRFRNNAVCTGDILMSEGTQLSYATGGEGFSMDAKIKLLGNVQMTLSRNPQDTTLKTSYMTFLKGFEGNTTVKVYNNSTTKRMLGRLILSGDNSNFTGIWDVVPAREATAFAAIEGTVENAFGAGRINIAAKNLVYFSHAQASGLKNILSLVTGAKAVMNTNATVGKLILAETEHTSGTFNATSHPDFFEGTGTLTVDGSSLSNIEVTMNDIYFDGQNIVSPAKNINSIKVYTINGQCVYQKTINGNTAPLSLNPGLYIVEVNSDKGNTFIKIVQ